MTDILIEYETYKRNSQVIESNLRADSEHWRKKYEDCDEACEKLTDMIGETLADNQAIKAQANGLRDASQAVLKREDCPFCDFGKLRDPEKPHWPECAYYQLEQALSRSPEDWREEVRLKEEVVRAAKDWHKTGAPGLGNAIRALEAWEGGK